MTAAACGAGGPPAGTSPSTRADAGSSTPGADVDGGDAGSKETRPFAGSASEATELISAAVDKRQYEIASCVREFRTRKKKAAPNRVVISIGIDQDGKLLGVTSKGKEDAELKGCVQESLKGALFPRSHAGVITVTKTYEDIVVP